MYMYLDTNQIQVFKHSSVRTCTISINSIHVSGFYLPKYKFSMYMLLILE